MGFIYVFENKINGKCYVGQTINNNINNRIYGHGGDSKRYNYPIGNAIRKYGLDNFNIYSLPCDEEDLDYFECGFIKQLNTLKPNGYNIFDGGNNKHNVPEDTRKKISIANKGKTGFHNKGKHFSDETKKKISENRKGITAKERHPLWGKHHSPETIEKMRKAHKGCIGWNKGKKMSQEFRDKNRLSHLGQKAWNKGIPRTKEVKEKLRLANLGKKLSPETILKMVKNNPNKRKVICIETNEIFNTIKEAGKNKNIPACNICWCCKKHYKIAGGYHWEYIK